MTFPPVGEGFADPVVAGTQLVIPAINSPNYVLGVTGWAIRRDGTAQFTGLVIVGGTFTGTNFVINNSGAFFYSGTPAAGNLIASITSASGTDSHSNAYVAGIAAYITVAAGLGAGRYAIDLGDQALPYANVASLTFKNLTHPPSLPPAVSAATDTTHGNSLSLDTGRYGAGANDAVMTLNDSTVTGTPSAEIFADTLIVQPVVNAAAALELLGFLEFVDLAAAPAAISGSAVLFGDVNGFLQFKPDPASGDTASYQVGHRELYNTNDQDIISTTFADICSGGVTVGTGAYRVRAVLTCVMGATSDINKYRLGFSGTISQVRMAAIFYNDSNPASPTPRTTTSNNGVLSSPAYPANTTYIAEIDGIIITTSSGLLRMQAAETTAGDDFTVLALSFFEIVPAN